MRIIDTSKVIPSDIPSQTERDFIYNGLDCCVTLEVLDVLLPQLNNRTAATYSFSKELEGPVIEMGARGVKVDKFRKSEFIEEAHETLDFLSDRLQRIVGEGYEMWGFKPGSSDDVKELFYNRMGLPEVRKKGRVTGDRNALEKLEMYLVARPIISHILAIRDIAKKLSVLKTAIDPDGRMRTGYNIAGTSTGRFSSSYSEFGTGGNLQNIEDLLRSILVADDGYKFAKFDAKSGESFCVGAREWKLFRDAKYLDACESGDPHTAVARICWPSLPWTGDLKRDKAIAESPYYRHYTYRFMCKKLGHGSNYGGLAETLSAQAKLPINVVLAFQPKYFAAFPAHQRWQEWVENELQTKGVLTTLTGRERWFFGRRNDSDTKREAIAYDPQGSLADIVNRAMLREWRRRRAILMFQDHDALTFMYPTEREDEIVPAIWNDLAEDWPLEHDRTLRIPYDCKVGWNKGDYCCGERKPECQGCNKSTNVFGLKDYTGQSDKRSAPEKVSFMDRKLHRSHG